uniref:Uncharacterized protein n=1 Tax=Dunaliella tertiolecta TaxID=3047 RepID=A0A7S3QQ20_DUNTE
MPGALWALFAGLLVASAHFFAPSTEGIQDDNVFKLPLMLIPPLTGVELQQKLDKPRPSPYFWCPTHSDWSTLWITPSILVPGIFSCAVENLKLIYSPRTNLSHSVDGVTVRPTHGFEKTLNPLAPLISELERLGWQWGKQLQAHIYDWRLSPNDWATAREFGWAELKRSIEELQEINGGRKVILAGISMGSTYINAFLHSMVTEEWKASNIAGFFSISGVFGGTPAAAQGIISGRLEGLEILFHKEDLLTLMRGLPVMPWLTPHPDIYDKGQVFIKNTATKRSYSAAKMDKAFSDAGAYQAAAAWQQVLTYPNHLPPNVTTYCLYSKGLKTIKSLKYSRKDFMDTPVLSYADGDSTVPLAGLKSACDNWVQAQELPVYSRVWENVGHAGILMAKGGVQYVVDAVKALGRKEMMRVLNEQA